MGEIHLSQGKQDTKFSKALGKNRHQVPKRYPTLSEEPSTGSSPGTEPMMTTVGNKNKNKNKLVFLLIIIVDLTTC